MIEAVRILLLLALAAAALTFAALASAWWFEAARRLRRAMRKVLGADPETEAVNPHQGVAAGIDFETASLAVLWDKGRSGLVYAFDEIEGAELIVDGQVAARTRRDEARRGLDTTAPEAEQVTLRLVFADARFPEFEVELWGPGPPGDLHSAAEAMRLGRRWLSHVEAILKRPPPPRDGETDLSVARSEG
ncbi:MAG TPA: hypothetical protein VGB49_04060 [Caulobacteraceae bacterium]